MARDCHREGYQQATQDFAEGKDYKPHKLSNLFGFIGGSKHSNDEFLRGYKEGWDYCKRQSLQREARELLKESGPGQQQNRSPNRLDLLNESRNGFKEAPDQEPEY